MNTTQLIKKIQKIGKYLVNSISNNKIKNASLITKYLIQNLENLVEALLENINPVKKVKSDTVIFVIGKLLRTIFKQDILFKQILNFQFFCELYFYTKSEKFVLSKETFKIILAILGDKKINKNIFANFLSENRMIFVVFLILYWQSTHKI